MTATEMNDLIKSLTGPFFGPIGNRIKRAGQRGSIWPLIDPEWRSYSETQRDDFAIASMLAACELQRIVEIHNAMQAGGVVIGL